MEDRIVFLKIRQGVQSFFSEVEKMDEKIYMFLLSSYISVYLLLEVAWGKNIGSGINGFRYMLASIVIWGSALYLIYIIIAWGNLWKKIPLIIAVGAGLLLVTWFFNRKMSLNSFGVVYDLFFILMVYGKSFRKILNCLFVLVSSTLLIAMIGVPLGFTIDMIKPDNIHPGHSLGIIYPNNWGNLVYLALILLWYLYLQSRPLLTIIAFWSAAAVMYIFIYSRTMSIFSFLFPLAAIAIVHLQKNVKKKEGRNNYSVVREEDISICNQSIIEKENRLSFINWIIIIIPLFSLLFVIAASLQMEWVHKTFYYTWFHNFAMRFVQGGFYLKTYGMPLFGNPYRSNVETYVLVNDEYLVLDNLDSSFVAYIIMRGMVWIIYTLSLLCIANWKAIKNGDYSIPLICTAILLFAMMERAGLEMWYNFILLYPLAKVSENTAETGENQLLKVLNYLPFKA